MAVVTDARWTDETENIVAMELEDVLPREVGALPDEAFYEDARRILAALADAGLLIPPGGETVTEYRCPVGVGVHPHRCPDTTHVRTVHTGPWQVA